MAKSYVDLSFQDYFITLSTKKMLPIQYSKYTRISFQSSFQGYFITDNRSVNKFANEVLKVALSGLSLTVISFTIVFLVFCFLSTLLFCIFYVFSNSFHISRSFCYVLKSFFTFLSGIFFYFK